ncbi:MAG: hypothetical protein LBQ00_06750 [Syntrophobacterales bacterium]|jgi:hypothetical protein|nr:hypothetical protein [Syntrophobacterales bacterium]
MKKNGRFMTAGMVLLAASILLTACGGSGGSTAVKTAQITKVTAEAALAEAVKLKASGAITESQFNDVKQAYETLRTAQGTLIDAREAYLKSPTQDTESAIVVAVLTVAARSSEFVEIAKKYHLGEE